MSLINELKRRNVFRVAIAYLVIAWLLAQVSGTFESALNLPPWFDSVVVSLLIIGFPIALLFAWVFELTPEGLKREKDIKRDDSIADQTSKKLNYVTIIAAVAVLGMFVWQQFGPKPDAVIVKAVEPVQLSSETDAVNEVNAEQLIELSGNSIAVLPFANRSNNDDDLYFTDGIHDDLLTQLAKIKGIKVISRTSVMQYRGTEKTIPEIAAELGVSTILEGGVQRAGVRIRINAQLIDVGGAEQHIWAETYDREMNIDNLFDIQSEITTHIITAIKGELTVDEQQGLNKPPTHNLVAYEYYLRAKQALNNLGHNLEGLSQAEPLVEQAIALDPNFALAHLLLSRIYSQKSWIGIDTSKENQLNAQQAIATAAAILPDDHAELLSARGNYLYRYESDFKAAHELQKRAFKLMPGNAEIAGVLGIIQRRIGLWDEAVVSLTLADKLNPSQPEWARHLAATLLLSHQYDALNELLVSLRARFPYDSSLASAEVAAIVNSTGDLPKARTLLDAVRPSADLTYLQIALWLPFVERDYQAARDAWNAPQHINVVKNWGTFHLVAQAEGYLKMNDTESAKELLKTALAVPIDDSLPKSAKAGMYINRAWAHSLLGHHEQAIKDANQAVEFDHYSDNHLDGLNTLSRKAYVLARAGRDDEAIELLKLIVNQPGGYPSWHYYLSPGWDFFRNNETFNQLIKPANFEQSIHAIDGEK